ncbi:uncharacterized protein LOC111263887 isoform X2 [Varroa jacobsoni]|nr:uncharacterized protein LOC111245324 isoform X2 [Varroa destructor]XP_022649276.1 uncharacterized protein LOC111245324 isoform X2 [Varroa destructor]XP_022649277.1 uncharacterized protein LOC111245324 isoform X2 [Varroa destructor]XP_022695120.1 uncharacterized protein LOC111263887 isoform X2 [Varroa jacobsoni]XP_022695128.1 uncharacterized protein LOC111263887 isoform X2 [Varroa jacobsoni]XP_022695135.1 uncharacterized protein LOC111263887 isoform X2 [Varroa jacobsoni]XP_022695142.1 uncha
MASPSMRELAQSITATGEAIKQFQEQFLPSLRKQTSGDSKKDSNGVGTEAVPSAARHAELIQSIMDNMDQIKQTAGIASTRQTLPVRPESLGDLSLRGAPVVLALSEIPQARLVAATRAKLAQADGLIHDVEQIEKLLQ